MAKKDDLTQYVVQLDSIPFNAEAIVPSDAADLPHQCRRIHIGGDGDLDVTLVGGTRVVFKGLVAGSEKTGAFKKVWAIGTTATNLIAEW